MEESDENEDAFSGIETDPVLSVHDMEELAEESYPRASEEAITYDIDVADTINSVPEILPSEEKIAIKPGISTETQEDGLIIESKPLQSTVKSLEETSVVADSLRLPSGGNIEADSGVSGPPLGSADKVQLQSMLDSLMGEAEELATHPSRSMFTFSELGLKSKKAAMVGDVPKSEPYQQLKTLFEHEESEFASKMPSIMELFASGIESSLTLNDFAWPRYAMDDPDQVYENLLAMTVINPDLSVMLGERVIMRKNHFDAMAHKVKIITGGYAGNEPLFSGYVGQGMATAAVIGDRKNSPKSLSVYKTIKELALHHDAGLLIIIPNLNNYRIVFGLAMERARSEGHLVDMIVIADDCCDHVETKSGRRCLAGIVLALKVAGAMAEDERTLKEIYLMVQSLLIASISAHVNDGNVFMGTGIKGGGYEVKCACNENEENCEKQPSRGCATRTHNKLRNIVEIMMDFTTGYKRYFALPLKPFSEVVVLINCYTEDKLFLYSAVAEVLRQLYCQDVVANRIYAGTFVSSKRGFSITFLKVFEEEVLHWLDYPTSVNAWPPSRTPSSIPIVTKSIYEMPVHGQMREFGPKFSKRQTLFVPYLIAVVMEDLIIGEAILNEFDPDRRFGTCIVKGCSGIAAANKNQQLNYNRPYNLYHQIAMILEDTVPGVVGSLLALFVGAMANEYLKYSEGSEVEYRMVGAALIAASKAVKTYSRINPDREVYVGDECIPAGNYLLEVAPELPMEDVLENLFYDAKVNITKARVKPYGWHYKGKEGYTSMAFLFVLKSLIRARKNVLF